MDTSSTCMYFALKWGSHKCWPELERIATLFLKSKRANRSLQSLKLAVSIDKRICYIWHGEHTQLQDWLTSTPMNSGLRPLCVQHMFQGRYQAITGSSTLLLHFTSLIMFGNAIWLQCLRHCQLDGLFLIGKAIIVHQCEVRIWWSCA